MKVLYWKLESRGLGKRSRSLFCDPSPKVHSCKERLLGKSPGLFNGLSWTCGLLITSTPKHFPWTFRAINRNPDEEITTIVNMTIIPLPHEGRKFPKPDSPRGSRSIPRWPSARTRPSSRASPFRTPSSTTSR